MRRSLIGLAALIALATACGTETTDTTTSADTTTTTAAPETSTSTVPRTTTAPTTTTIEGTTTTQYMEEMDVVAYFLVDDIEEEGKGPFLVPVHGEVPETEGVAAAAVNELIAGPTDDEVARRPAISSAVPPETRLLGIVIEDGVATVDLSGEFDDGGGTFSMQARLAQLVYTLTQYPTVDSVLLELDGEPVEVFSSEGLILEGPQTRDDYLDLLPLIFVDSPAWGEPVTSPVTVTGVANVFEATLQIMLTDDDGDPLFEDTVTATCGTGCWGDFTVTIPYEVDRDQFGALIVWDFSAKDGSRQNVREYPVQLR